MRSFNRNFFFPLTFLILAVYALSNQFFGLPPFGQLLDPFIGAVQNEVEEPFNLKEVTEKKDSVEVYFDNRKVPHIYARNTKDLFFTQGYIIASMRLWQMDFTSYAAAGRLSEIFPKGYLDYDRNQRRLGILEAAKASLDLMEKDSLTFNIISAYTQGVNAYIKQLSYKTMPFEYKFFDYKPEPWTNLKTVLIVKYLAYTLSGYDEDYNMTNLMMTLGENAFNKLYPAFSKIESPNIDSTYGKINNSLRFQKKPKYLDNSFINSKTLISNNLYNPKLGSNSWVVSGKKTKSGNPILCTDPHLNLTLPSTWFEVQLSAPGINVYGVSVPGVPAVILGFNENIAWGMTNGEDDVRDWYKLRITDDYKKYYFDGQWLKLSYRVEKIKIKEQKAFYDTIYHTIQGPIVSTKNYPGSYPTMMNYALRWELSSPSNEILTFIKLNMASNYKEYIDAISYFNCPIQNFTFACKDNTIAINHQGHMAIKWPGQGKFILDGTKKSHLYNQFIANKDLPHAINPSCNYLLSANQHPTNYTYPYYYNGHYYESRATRINELLKQENQFDITKMQRMQLDNVNVFAKRAIPILTTRMMPLSSTPSELTMLKNLAKWRGAYNFNDVNATFYELWWKYIKLDTWDEYGSYNFHMKQPDDEVLLEMIQSNPNDAYFDIMNTSQEENADSVIKKSFAKALLDYYSMKQKGGIKWGEINKLHIVHLSHINTFSRVNMQSDGYSEAINAKQQNWGPSWRMIVELGKRPRGYGIYPGGQSGSLGSPYYENSVNDWNSGKYYPLHFYMSKDEAKKNSISNFEAN